MRKTFKIVLGWSTKKFVDSQALSLLWRRIFLSLIESNDHVSLNRSRNPRTLLISPQHRLIYSRLLIDVSFQSSRCNAKRHSRCTRRHFVATQKLSSHSQTFYPLTRHFLVEEMLVDLTWCLNETNYPSTLIDFLLHLLIVGDRSVIEISLGGDDGIFEARIIDSDRW